MARKLRKRTLNHMKIRTFEERIMENKDLFGVLVPELTPKQNEYLDNANSKYNVFGGATGSGKTYLARWILPMRIMACSGAADKSIAIIANTQGSAIRNLINPLREFYGASVIGYPKGKTGQITMFGKEVFVFGGDKKSNLKSIQGQTLEYVYADEIVTWNEDFWQMFVTRLRVDGCKMDGTCNPNKPSHWFKLWMDEMSKKENAKDILYYLKTTIFDGKLDPDPEKDAKLKQDIIDSVSGVFAKWYIDGDWANVEGVIYNRLANNPDKYYIDKKDLPRLDKVFIGVDYGNNKSKHAYVATGYNMATKSCYVLDAKELDPVGMDSSQIVSSIIDFVDDVEYNYGVRVEAIESDFSDRSITLSVKNTLKARGTYRNARDCMKRDIIERIMLTDNMICTDRLFFVRSEGRTAEQLKTSGSERLLACLLDASWDPNSEEKKRYDKPGETMIDLIDAFEYTIERYYHKFLSIINPTKQEENK